MKPVVPYIKEKTNDINQRFRVFMCKYIFEHEVVVVGGRGCRFVSDDRGGNCSQPVFQCNRCGAMDYGGPHSMGEKWCKENCLEGYYETPDLKDTFLPIKGSHVDMIRSKNKAKEIERQIEEDFPKMKQIKL